MKCPFKRIIERVYLSLPNNLAYYDVLTGCKNRLCFERVAKRRYHDKAVWVTYVDIDGLKTVNDQMGHSEGNRLICSVADRLTIIPSADVYRLGGDEFVVISKLPIKRIRGASVGSAYKESEADLGAVTRIADKLMYEQKEGRKNEK